LEVRDEISIRRGQTSGDHDFDLGAVHPTRTEQNAEKDEDERLRPRYRRSRSHDHPSTSDFALAIVSMERRRSRSVTNSATRRRHSGAGSQQVVAHRESDLTVRLAERLDLCLDLRHNL